MKKVLLLLSVFLIALASFGQAKPSFDPPVVPPINHQGFTFPMIRPVSSASTAKTVRVYIEADYSLFVMLGNKEKVKKYVEDLFEQARILFAMEKINIELSETYIWENEDPFGQIFIAGNLMKAFKAYIKSSKPKYNGDVAFLLTSKNVGGMAARGCILRPDKTNAIGLAGAMKNTIKSVPTWSDPVHIFTHEMGHALGSWHTHSCRWNGNNTPIDGCTIPDNNGTCERGPIPARNSATIMSYGKALKMPAVGVNFSLGFGPQPGALIRDTVANSTRLPAIQFNSSEIVISDPVDRNYTPMSGSRIIASSVVASNTLVAYRASQVILKPGFHVKPEPYDYSTTVKKATENYTTSGKFYVYVTSSANK